ncbi:hypothetical protein Leryth_006253 [Lithospermum erythrorhizon]|nr:hypothetical protein Leryth_006253 [Lithospermum erythrorhizon]
MGICWRASNMWITIFVLVAIIGQLADAGRPLMEPDFAGANHLRSYPSSSIYEQAKDTMSSLLERLASGPSPKGPGH